MNTILFDLSIEARTAFSCDDSRRRMERQTQTRLHLPSVRRIVASRLSTTGTTA